VTVRPAGAHFDAYAVLTDRGPHVTLQAGVVHLGRHWTSASRSSVKAAAVRRRRWASVTTGRDGSWRVRSGPAVSLDVTDPGSLLVDPIATSLAGGAVARLGLSRLDQLVGYAQVGAGVPAEFQPTGRVLLATRVHDELVVADGRVVSGRGRWAVVVAPLEVTGRRARRSARLPDAVPAEIAALADAPGPCWLGVISGDGAVAVAATWDPSTGGVEAAAEPLAALAPGLPGPVCVTFDDSRSRRPDEKAGLLLRGRGAVARTGDGTTSVTFEVDRVTWWQGFASRSTDV